MTEGWIMLIIFVILVVFAGVNLELSYRRNIGEICHSNPKKLFGIFKYNGAHKFDPLYIRRTKFMNEYYVLVELKCKYCNGLKEARYSFIELSEFLTPEGLGEIQTYTIDDTTKLEIPSSFKK